MTDEAEAKGIKIDEKALSAVLGIPMTKTVGSRGGGVEALLDLIDSVADAGSGGDAGARTIRYGAELEDRLRPIETAVQSDPEFSSRFPVRWLSVKLLEKDAHAFEKLKEHSDAAKVERAAKESIAWIEKHYGKDVEVVISEQRYGYIRGAVKEAVKIVRQPDFSITEAIDQFIMNRFLSLPIFVAVLWATFQITFAVGAYPMAWLETFFAWLSGAASSALGEGVLRSLVVDGVIAGVGGVFSFVPLIVILFFLLSLLEDIGYMSRAAFATDKWLHAFGLHGQSVFPMMLGFGCSVPAIMAARTLKSPRDRIVTVLVIPFISCGAKLPVHVLLAAAFFPKNAANVVMLIYAIGVALALTSALVLRKTVLKGDPTPFVMELPPYRAPTLMGVLWHVWEKTWQYVKKMGTVILAASILIWAITTFPSYTPGEAELARFKTEFLAAHPGADDRAVSEHAQAKTAEAALGYSVAGRLGKAVEPLFRPLGFNWKIGAATVTGFAAKEVMVSTLGILYSGGSQDTEGRTSLQDALRADPDFNPLVAFILMLFTLTIPPCFAALAAIRAELGWKWLAFAFGFMLTVGWSLGTLVYQVGRIAGVGI